MPAATVACAQGLSEEYGRESGGGVTWDESPKTSEDWLRRDGYRTVTAQRYKINNAGRRRLDPP